MAQETMANFICKECGALTNDNEKKVHGSFGVEIGLYVLMLFGFMFFVLPGIIIGIIAICYSVRRYTRKGVICASCESRNSLIPTSTPRGKAIAEKYS